MSSSPMYEEAGDASNAPIKTHTGGGRLNHESTAVLGVVRAASRSVGKRRAPGAVARESGPGSGHACEGRG